MVAAQVREARVEARAEAEAAHVEACVAAALARERAESAKAARGPALVGRDFAAWGMGYRACSRQPCAAGRACGRSRAMHAAARQKRGQGCARVAAQDCPDAPRPADHGALTQVREARAEACAEAEAAVEARVAAAVVQERAQLSEQVLSTAWLGANSVPTRYRK